MVRQLVTLCPFARIFRVERRFDLFGEETPNDLLLNVAQTLQSCGST